MSLTKILKLFVVVHEIVYVYSNLSISKSDMGITSKKNVKNSLRNRTLHDDDIYNPVLKDYSALFERIKMDTKNKRTRQKRQLSAWSCSGLCKQSLCSWTEKVDYDDKRIPASITKAECSNTCNFKFTELKLPKILNVLTTCQPFTTDVPIFKNNEITYLRDWPIACICTKRPISHVPKKYEQGKYVQRRQINLHKMRRHRQTLANHQHKLRQFHHKYYKIKSEVTPFLFLPQYK